MIHLPVAPWFETDSHGARVRVWLAEDTPVDTLYLRVTPDNEEELITMVRVDAPWTGIPETGALGQWWQTELPLDTANPQTLYCFKLLSQGEQLWLDATGHQRWLPPESQQFRYHPEFVTPDWVPGQVFYQIFPDRFAASGAGHAVKTDEYLFYAGKRQVKAKAWGELPERGGCDFFGGDLPGISSKLDYFEQLGVTALYLNPVFTAPSNHRYDTTDYFSVDPHLGGDQALIDLSTQVHERGMHLVLDAVFNHTSAMHPWLTEPDSPQRSWYLFDDDGQAKGWKGFSGLPVLDYANAEVQDYFYAAHDSVLRHWLRPPYNLDGWRFDVIHMLGEGDGAAHNARHVSGMRQALKQENPNAYFLGEHFFEAARWLQGDQEDGAMNYYGFAHPVRAFLAGQDIACHPMRIDAAEFAQWLTRALAAVPFQAQLCQLNLLDSHDTPRFLSLLDGDREAMQLAVLLQMTWVGVPSIYYGDEIGLEGGHDPDCRRCFPWQEEAWDRSLLSWYQRLIRARHELVALQRGGVQFLHSEGDVLVYARILGDQRVLVALNRSPYHAQTFSVSLQALGLLEGEARCLLGEQVIAYRQGEMKLSLQSRQAVLLPLTI